MPRPAKVVIETPREVRRAVSILPEQLQDEYVAVPSDLQRWASMHAQADEGVRLAELDLEVWEAKRRQKTMDDWRAENEGLSKEERTKPPTEAMQEAIVVGDPEYRALRLVIIERVRAKGEAGAMVEGIRSKREMLVSLGADRRQEREQDPTIRDRRQARRP